jgi:general secretion pathway protein I
VNQFKTAAKAATRGGSAQGGFTLLEVLVAVTVLALALTAIIAGGSNYARSATGLRDKTVALWVARNRLAEIELLPVWPQVGTASDDVQMGGDTWTWRTEVLSTQDPTLRRINIGVEKKSDAQKHNYIELSSFISGAGRQQSQ